MLRWTDPDATPAALRPCVATFGNFDGVHRGHRVVIETLIAQGAQRDLPVVVLTFDPHPVQVLHPERAPELISPGALHEQLLEATGIDGLLVVDFTAEYAQQSAADFIVDTFVHGLQVAALVVGADTKGFGVGYTGDVELIRRLGAGHGFDVVVVDDQGDGARWSSSAAREHLRGGELPRGDPRRWGVCRVAHPARRGPGAPGSPVARRHLRGHEPDLRWDGSHRRGLLPRSHRSGFV